MRLLISMKGLHINNLVRDIFNFFYLFLKLVFARNLQIADVFDVLHAIDNLLDPVSIHVLGLVKVRAGAPRRINFLNNFHVSKGIWLHALIRIFTSIFLSYRSAIILILILFFCFDSLIKFL